MTFDRFKRRTYLGAVAGAVASLGGCQSLLGSDDTEQQTDQTTQSTATGEGSESVQQGVQPHMHSGEGDGGGAVAPQETHNQVYAAAMPGDTLAEKVRAAVDRTARRRTIIITPRADGDPWTWDQTVTFNLREIGGTNLLFRGMTMIEYTGDSWAMEVTFSPPDYGQIVQGDLFHLHGGYWQATGNPDGWLRLSDTNYSTIHPYLVREFMNDEKTATGIRVVNDGLFCEANTYAGIFDKIDIGMDFVPADVSGGSGTNSFGSTYIQALKVYSFNRCGFRFRENAGFYNSTVHNPMALAGTGNDQAEDLAAYDLGGDFNGTVFISPKIEDAGAAANPGPNETNDAGFRLRSSLATPPLVLNPADSFGVDQLVERDEPDKRLPALKVQESGHAHVHDLGRLEEETRFDEGGVTFASQTMFGPGSQEPETAGNIIYHPGNDNVAEGLYRADPENSQWVKVEDNSVTLQD